MKKKNAFPVAFAFALAISLTLLAACNSTSVTTNTGTNPNTVTMNATQFTVAAISIKKGATITFVNEASSGALHILVVGQNGENGSEPGAPDFGGFAGHRSYSGDSWTTAPWNTAGTYHVTCTVHPMMNITVTVTG